MPSQRLQAASDTGEAQEHVQSKHALVATIAERTPEGSRQIMEEAALGPEAASELAAARKRVRSPEGAMN